MCCHTHPVTYFWIYVNGEHMFVTWKYFLLGQYALLYLPNLKSQLWIPPSLIISEQGSSATTHSIQICHGSSQGICYRLTLGRCKSHHPPPNIKGPPMWRWHSCHSSSAFFWLWRGTTVSPSVPLLQEVLYQFRPFGLL